MNRYQQTRTQWKLVARLITLFVFFSLFAPDGFTAEKEPLLEGDLRTDYRYSDSHIHIVNFLQQGEFYNFDKRYNASALGELEHQRFLTPPAGERWRRIAGVLRCMDQGSINTAILFGLPVLKKWADNDTYERPDGYLDNESHVLLARDTDLLLGSAVFDYQRKYADDEIRLRNIQRIAPFMCGFDPTDLGSVDLLIERIKEYPGVWQGIGEVFVRHDDVTHMSLGERPRANHPALLRVCKFAGKVGLPVSIHQNIAPVSRPGVMRKPVYIDELIDLLRYCHEDPGSGHQSTVFIWCHGGISRRVHVEKLSYWIDQVLEVYADHLYVDLSWVVRENYIDKEQDKWVKLVEKYPQRFLLGSDVVGGASRAGEELEEYEPWLSQLKPETRRLVATENLIGLLSEMAEQRRLSGLTCEKAGSDDALTDKDQSIGLRGIALPADYFYPEYADMPRLADEESFVRSRLKLQELTESEAN